jgi:hypothetical protein
MRANPPMNATARYLKLKQEMNASNGSTTFPAYGSPAAIDLAVRAAFNHDLPVCICIEYGNMKRCDQKYSSTLDLLIILTHPSLLLSKYNIRFVHMFCHTRTILFYSMRRRSMVCGVVMVGAAKLSAVIMMHAC